MDTDKNQFHKDWLISDKFNAQDSKKKFKSESHVKAFKTTKSEYFEFLQSFQQQAQPTAFFINTLTITPDKKKWLCHCFTAVLDKRRAAFISTQKRMHDNFKNAQTITLS